MRELPDLAEAQLRSLRSQPLGLGQAGLMALAASVVVWLILLIDLLIPDTGLPAGVVGQGVLMALCVVVSVMAACIIRLERHLAGRTAIVEMLSSVLDGLPIEICLKNVERRYVWFNATWAKRRPEISTKILGRTLPELGLGLSHADAVDAHDSEVFAAGVEIGPRDQVILDERSAIHQVDSVTKFPVRVGGTIRFLATVGIDIKSIREEQRAAEEKRRQLEEVLDAVPVTLQIVDQDMTLQWANKAYCRMLGKTPSEVIGQPLKQVAADRLGVDRAIAANHALLATGQGQVILEQHVDATDWRPERYLQVIKAVISAQAGSGAHILTIGIDVTAQRRAEIEAEAGRRLMEGILRHAPLAIHVKDAELRYRWANQAFSDLVYRPVAGLIGQKREQIVTSDQEAEDIKFTDERDRQVLQTREPVSYITTWPHYGKPNAFMVIKAPIIGTDGQSSHVVTFVADINEREQLRAEAEEARLLLQSVMDALPVMVALKDRDHRYRWVNREFERRWGRLSSEVIGRTMQDCGVAPDFADVVTQSEIEVLQTGIEPAAVIRTTPGEGEEPDIFSVRRMPLRDTHGQISGILSVGVDVTTTSRLARDLKALNEELEDRVAARTRDLDQANTLLHTVIRSSPVPIFTHDAEGRILVWNPAMIRLVDLAEAEVIGQLLPVWAKPGLLALQDIVDETRGGRGLANRAVRLGMGPGLRMDVLVNSAPLHDPDGRLRGGVIVLLDETERKQALEAAQTARNNLIDALEGSQHAIVLYDSEDRVVLFNQHFRTAYGEIGELMRPGVTFEEGYRLAIERGVVLIPEGQSAEEVIATRMARRRSGVVSHHVTRHADGRSFEVWENRARNGGIITIAADITDKLAIEAQLVQAQRMEAVGQLTGGLAHDFNNVLASINLNLDLIRLHQPDMAMVTQLADAAQGAVQIGAALTRRLLAFARQQKLRPEPTDLQALVADLAPLLRSTLGEAVTLSIDTAVPSAIALIDPGQLQTALLNLAANARDAMPEGGQFAITLGEMELVADDPGVAPDLAVALAPGRYVTVAVRDSGCGMAPDVLGRVFEPFFSTKPPSEGSGLGLTMVFGFARQSGGHVRICSEVGRFTEVTLYLPQTSDEVAATLVPDALEAQSHQGELILVVEDDPAVRTAFAQMLGHLGYRSVVAEDGPQALALLEAHAEIAAMVSDVVLPRGMNGFDLAGRARKLRPDLAVLFASGFTDPQRLGEHTLPEGAVLMPKPFGMAELERQLLGCLARRVARGG